MGRAVAFTGKKSMGGRFVLLFGLAAAVAGILGLMCAGYIRMHLNIPPGLLEFALKYPEARQFAWDYPEKKNLDAEIDLTDEVTPGEIPLFIQWDERWGYKTYGNNLLGINGCGPTCISMLVCGLTGDLSWNPYEVAKFSEEKGYYLDGTGTSWALMTEGAQILGLNVEQGTVSADYIREYLTSETPMIASVMPGDFTYTGHFIVLTGFDGAGNVTVNDPNSPANSAKSWPVETLVEQMKGLWRYR